MLVSCQMKAAENPFSPGAGTQPPELTGRNANLERARIILERVKSGRPDRSSLLIGLRGVGKTVLLNRLQEMAEKDGYYTFLVESPEATPLAELLAPGLRQLLLKLDRNEGTKEKLRIAMNGLRSFASAFNVTIGDIGISVSPSPGIADSGVLNQDIIDLLIAVGEAAREAHSAIAIFIDELQYVQKKELSALFAGIHRIGQLGLPLVIFGAGLPQLAGLSGEAKSYAERLFEFQSIGPLGNDDARLAITEPLGRHSVAIEEAALDMIINSTEGYPYFLQEWGAHAWLIAGETPITKLDIQNATEAAITTLDNGFFRVRFDRLTPSEKEYLRAMAELGKGPHRSGDVAAKLGRQVEVVAPIRSKVISKGMVYAPAHGDTAFTVPKFDEYMKRVMPEFVPHRVKSKRK